MKKQLLPFLLLALLSIIANEAFTQCPYTANSVDLGVLSITTTQQQATAMNGNYYTMDLVADDTIIIQSVNYNIEITLWDNSYSIITSSNVGDLQYTVTTAETYYVHFSDANCLEDGSALDDFTYVINHAVGGGGTGTQGTPIGSIGGDFFVQGVSPVINNISVQNPEPTAAYIDFFATDASHTTIYNSQVGGGLTWDLDMGSLPEGATIWANYYDNTHTYLDSSFAYSPSIIPTPQWLLSNGTVDNVNVSGTTVNMLGHFNFLSQTPTMPDDVPGLGNEPFEVLSPDFSFNIDFDCTSGTATANSPNANFNLNVLNQNTYTYSFPISTGATLTFPQPDFNPQIIAEGAYNTPQYNLNWPLARIYLPYPVIKVDGGLTIEGELKGKIQYGYNSVNSAWGIDTARITAKVNATAILRVKADALIASVTGTLEAKGSIGEGLYYSDFYNSSFPNNTQGLFGLNLQIAGALDAQLGWGWLSHSWHWDKTFYDKTWGDQIRSPFEKQIWDKVDVMGNYTRMLLTNPYLQTPEFFAQPNMSANDSTLYVVWLDHSGSNTDILFNKLDYQTSTFSTPLNVASAQVISNPKVAILPSGNALLAWTQNRYTDATFNTTSMNLNDLFKGQDIWVSLYDKATNTFAIPQMLGDDISTLESGRAEGNANIIMGKGNYGLITWVVNNDTTNTNADVWYVPVTDVSGNVLIGTPSQLINLTGTNKSININFYDSIHAVACWINDPDGTDSTLNNQVVYQVWTQTSTTEGTWGSQFLLIGNDGETSFDALSTDFNGYYGAVAWTSTHYDANGRFAKQITADAWDSGLGQWASPAMAEDSSYTFNQPKVSVNKNGFVALTYQDVAIFDDTLHPDVGRLNLYLNDSQTDPNTWTTNSGNPLLGDPAVYDWDLNTAYGDSNNFYIITQEADTTTGNAPLFPPNGAHFGNGYLNLVIRALDVTPYIITDIPEPSTIATFTKGNLFDFNLYPNPISTYTTIEYIVNNQSSVVIEIYDLLGNKVASVFEGKQSAGTYKAVFQPNSISNGVYFCKVAVNNQIAVKKMIIAK